MLLSTLSFSDLVELFIVIDKLKPILKRSAKNTNSVDCRQIACSEETKSSNSLSQISIHPIPKLEDLTAYIPLENHELFYPILKLEDLIAYIPIENREPALTVWILMI